MLKKLTCCVQLYVPYSINDHRKLWGQLKEVKEIFGAHLLVMADFNEILNVEERSGARSITRSMKEFDEWVDDLNLVDLPIVGRKFTWRRGKSCSKLDRIFVDPQ